MKVVKDGDTKFFPSNWEKTYFQWMENIRPWCISRQIWWGHQIPVWYGPDGKEFCAETEEEAKNLKRSRRLRHLVLLSSLAFLYIGMAQ